MNCFDCFRAFVLGNNPEVKSLSLPELIKEGDLSKLRSALSRSNVNAVDSFGNTPLHLLVRHKDLSRLSEMLPLFLEFGADINAQNSWGETPLYLLFSDRASLFFSDAQSSCSDFKALFLVFEQFMQSGADASLRTVPSLFGGYQSWSPLETVVSYQSTELLDLFLRYAANPSHLLQSSNQAVKVLINTPQNPFRPLLESALSVHTSRVRKTERFIRQYSIGGVKTSFPYNPLSLISSRIRSASSEFRFSTWALSERAPFFLRGLASSRKAVETVFLLAYRLDGMEPVSQEEDGLVPLQPDAAQTSFLPALPLELWLFTLSFLRLSELGREPSRTL